MKRNNNTKYKKIIGKRLVSLLVSLVFVICAFYVDATINEDNPVVSPKVLAASDADDPVFKHVPENSNNISVSIEDLTAYSQACAEYHKYHQNDNLTILGSTGDTKYFEAGFQGLGTSTYPFAGSVTIENNANVTLNLDAPLFNYVLDSVVLNNGHDIKIAREYSSSRTDIAHTTPILAAHVIHDEDNSSASWNVIIDQPSDDKDDISYNLEEFGGVIGTMEENASLTVSVTMNTTEDDTDSIKITGADDLGFACCTMEDGSSLDFTLTATRGIDSIITKKGNVGGLVGTIGSGASFEYSGSNIQENSSDIKTSSSGYAGGVSGSNSGTVTINSTPYVIKQNIEGTNGSGGVYGNFVPSSDLTINTSDYTINCEVNGKGVTGGLFGLLDSEYDITISGSGTIKSSHYSGSASAYGGLIGKYKTDSKTRTLTIGSVTTETHKSGSSTYYGGGIGLIDDMNPSYVKFDGFTVNKAYDAGALTFGGLVASADNTFVDANNVTIAVDGKFKGGAMVGHIDHGIVRLTGSTTITNAKSAVPTVNDNTDESKYVGQLVGYRDNALVFADSGWQYNRYKDNVLVDDIGSWVKCSDILLS